MSDAPFEMTRAELEAIHEKFREVKHDINNTLAVIMALSELAQRNSAHYEKLGKAVLTRGPNVVQMLQDFQSLLVAKLKPGDGTPPASAPTSGVFQ
jgi:two-component sensor histidine kinase